LVVDDEPAIRKLLSELAHPEFEVLVAPTAEAARQILSQRSVDILLADQQLPGQSGVQLLEHFRLHSPETVRIMMTGHARHEDLVDAVNFARVHHYITKPWKSEHLLETLRQAARAFNSERNEVLHQAELRRLNQELEQRVKEQTKELVERAKELEDANRQLGQRNSMLRRMALTDPLTGVPNRRMIDRLAKRELARRARYPSSMALAIVDADNFKEVNTRHLHDGGDVVLTWLAQTLSSAIRHDVDTVGKIGGDEFMIVAPETDLEGAQILGERVRNTVAQGSVEYEGESIRLTVSIGIGVAPADDKVSFDQLRHLAAVCLNEAKSQGRNCCVVRVMPKKPEPPAAAALV
jgi:diguanylate cyclase (GGDEF)-like protein